MIFIRFKESYKSFSVPGQYLKLPTLTVISGVNGSGKSQLLEGITNNHFVASPKGVDGPFTRIKFLGNKGFRPAMYAPHVPHEVKAPIRVLNQKLTEFKQMLRKNRFNESAPAIQGVWEYQQLLEIARSARKLPKDLTSEDLIQYYDFRLVHPQSEIFQYDIASLFFHYHMRRLENEFNQFLDHKHGGIRGISDEEFLRRHGGPPWDMVNRVVSGAGLAYRLLPPEELGLEDPYQFRLINNVNGARISVGELSPGEKVIFSLALAILNAGHRVEFPDLLLLDEPDAHLHPLMVKQFLQMIQAVFVEEKGVNVLITTHSPTTVALAPEDALFQMNKTSPRIVKVSRDRALRDLLAGVPTISVDFENRRQVFVESENDARRFEKLFERLRCRLEPLVSLHFISAGQAGSEGCANVRNIVNTLVGCGNRKIFGIIDRDQGNVGNKHIKVLGGGNRYSIENYVFDPVLLACFLLRTKAVSRKQFGLTETENFNDIGSFDSGRLQTLADHVLAELEANTGVPKHGIPEIAHYVNERTIMLPSWFVNMNGHDLEDVVRKTYPPLEEFRRVTLMSEILNTVFDELPDLVSKDILDTFEGIQDLARPQIQ